MTLKDIDYGVPFILENDDKVVYIKAAADPIISARRYDSEFAVVVCVNPIDGIFMAGAGSVIEIQNSEKVQPLKVEGGYINFVKVNE